MKLRALPVALIGFVTGLAAGGLGGLLGIGGGAVMVPLLTGWARMRQHRAHGTSLVAVVFTGIVGALVYAADSAVSWRTAGWLVLGSIPATMAAARLSVAVPASSLRRVFGAFLVVTAVLLPLKDRLPVAGAWHGEWPGLALLALGIVVGALAGLLGVGGGALVVPALVLGPGMPQHLAQGTSLAAMVPAGIAGAAVHAGLGHVRRDVALPLLAGVAAGSFAGGTGALTLPGPTLRLIFAGVLLWLGGRYLLRPAPPPEATPGVT